MCIGKIRYHTMRGAMKVAGGGRSMTVERTQAQIFNLGK